MELTSQSILAPAVDTWCGMKMGQDKGPPDLTLGLLLELLVGENCVSPLPRLQEDDREAEAAGDRLVITNRKVPGNRQRRTETLTPDAVSGPRPSMPQALRGCNDSHFTDRNQPKERVGFSQGFPAPGVFRILLLGSDHWTGSSK